jgi:Putative Flp pilus-assembly TadE/G-like
VKSKHQFPARRRQRGQTVLWFLATIAACCCVFALVYNVGQVTNHKEATVNAADAAALSGALVEARMLNFEAYTNRAIIANEVTIAQIVSLDSWLNYDNEILQYIAVYTSPIPYLDDITQSIAQASQTATDVMNPILANAVQPIEYVNVGLMGAREAANYAGAVAANDIAGQIAAANETVFGVTPRYDEKTQLDGTIAAAYLLFNEIDKAGWAKFTDGYTDDKRAAAKSVILNSRDPFSTYRGEGELIRLLNIGQRALGLNTAYTNFQKTSGRTTLQNYDNWAAQDSLDATFTINPCVLFDCSYTFFLPGPIGYGRTDANSSGKHGDDLCDVSPSTENCDLALQNFENIYWSNPISNGMPNIRDLAEGLLKDRPCSKNNGSDSPSLAYVAAVEKKADATLTTHRPSMGMDVDVPGPQGSPLMEDNVQNKDQLTSISTACTFFLRPDLRDLNNKADVTGGGLARADGVHEYASLYNPYWQARLTTPDSDTANALYALIGHLDLVPWNTATQ